MNEKQTRAKYTLEFKQEAVRQVKAGCAASAVATTLGMPKASLTNMVRADAKGQLEVTTEGKATTLTVTPEQAEIARLKAQVARLMWSTKHSTGRANADAGGGHQHPVQRADFAEWWPYAIYRAWRAACFEVTTSHMQLEEIRRARRYPTL